MTSFCVVNLVGTPCVYANVAYTHEFPPKFTAHYPTNNDVWANIYVFPFVTEQHTKCSNRAFVFLKMGIMMPETC